MANTTGITVGLPAATSSSPVLSPASASATTSTPSPPPTATPVVRTTPMATLPPAPTPTATVKADKPTPSPSPTTAAPSSSSVPAMVLTPERSATPPVAVASTQPNSASPLVLPPQITEPPAQPLTPSTTQVSIPSTSSLPQQPQTDALRTEETIEEFSSTTLPPSIDATVLDGGELVRVETKATTHRDGQTTVSYTVVVKRGDAIETLPQPVFNTTNASALLPPRSIDQPSQSQQQQQASATTTNSNTNVTMIASVVAAVFISLIVGVFVLRRRHQRQENATRTAAAAAATSTTTSPKLSSIVRFAVLDSTCTSSRASSQSDYDRSSPRARGSNSMWEDAVIVAARIPFDSIVLAQLLSRGAFGEVYRGSYRTQLVAIKRLVPETRRQLPHIERFLREIKLHASLEHPHIVAFIGVAWESLSELFAVVEFMDRGDLRSYLLTCDANTNSGAITTDVAANSTALLPLQTAPQGFSAAKVTIALHVAHALTYLHSLEPPMLHRDVKSRNVLLCSGVHTSSTSSSLVAKLTDFGASRHSGGASSSSSSDPTMTAGVGSSRWMAPEVMLGQRYDAKSDVFSLGVVLSELDTHALPYANMQVVGTSGSASGKSHALPETALLQLVAAGRLEVQFSTACSPEMLALARRCLRLEPNERPTAAEAMYELHVVLRRLEGAM